MICNDSPKRDESSTATVWGAPTSAVMLYSSEALRYFITVGVNPTRRV